MRYASRMTSPNDMSDEARLLRSNLAAAQDTHREACASHVEALYAQLDAREHRAKSQVLLEIAAAQEREADSRIVEARTDLEDAARALVAARRTTTWVAA